MMTFAEFKKTGVAHSIESACEILGFNESDFADSSVVQFWIYDHETWMTELANSTYHLILTRDEWILSKEEIEARLFFHWYVDQCTESSDWDLESLVGLLRDWSNWTGQKYRSADEMLAEIPDTLAQGAKPEEAIDATDRMYRFSFLEWFISTWESVQLKEDGKGFGGRA